MNIKEKIGTKNDTKKIRFIGTNEKVLVTIHTENKNFIEIFLNSKTLGHIIITETYNIIGYGQIVKLIA